MGGGFVRVGDVDIEEFDAKEEAAIGEPEMLGGFIGGPAIETGCVFAEVRRGISFSGPI